MKYENIDQIPEGMLDRIEKRLAEHTCITKKHKKTKLIVLIAAIVLIVPISGFAVANLEWGWQQGIKIAVDNGKSVELNTDFYYENHKITFENAVWEDYALLITYSIPDADEEGAVIPSATSLVNKSGVSVSSSGGTEYDGEGKGTLRFDLRNDIIEGENLYLLVHTLQDAQIRNKDFKLMLDKKLLSDEKINVSAEFPTDYGVLKINSARYEKGRLYLGYKLDLKNQINKIRNSSYSNSNDIIYNFFPRISLKDAKNNILYSNERYSAPDGNSGELYFTGKLEALDKPVTVSINCSEKLADWKLPVKIFRPVAKTIKVDRKYNLEGGTLKIKNLYLGSATSYLDYIFTPGKDSDITGIQPFISAKTKDKKYRMTLENNTLSGKLLWMYPLNSADINNTKFKLFAIYRTVKYDKTVALDSKNIPSSFDIDGTTIRINSMEAKAGKVKIELELKDSRRKFYDFDIVIKNHNAHTAVTITSSVDFENPSVEEKFKNNPDLITKEDMMNTTVKKTIEFDGEIENATLSINSLIYADIYNKEIRIK